MAAAPAPSAVREDHASSPATAVSPPGAWLALGMLGFIYVLNFLDRQLLSILAKPIQDSLHLTDSQLGRIGGLYFALFYCLISIPVGWLADRTNRVRLVSIACALWSAATAACGLSATYGQLVAARMAVGIGEAGGVPPSYAIISDYFPNRRRGTAFGLYNLGPPVGQALGIAFGASIAAAWSWRTAFLAIGAVGVVTALVSGLVLREPRRGGLDPARPAAPGVPAEAAPGFRRTLGMFVSSPRLMLIALACGAAQMITYGSSAFTTLLLMREKGMTLDQVAVFYALVVGVGMSAGIFLSGRLVDRFAGRSRQAYALIPAIGLMIAAPLFVGFVWSPTWPLALVLLLGPLTFNYFYLSPAVAFVQDEVAPHQRVLSGALLLLIMNLIGLGLGPTFVGAASDWFKDHGQPHALQLAFYALLPFYAVAVALFLWLAAVLRGRRTIAGDMS